MNRLAILCVDDEEVVLISLKHQLKRHFANYHIEIAESGAEALEIITELAEDEVEIGVVISDYLMPVMKGDELLKQIHLMSPKTINILLTGQASTDGITNAVNQANLYRYITKPWEQSDLVLTITEALRRYNQDRQLEEQNKTLQQVNQQLAQLNATLENQVKVRTAELETTYKNMQLLHDRMQDELTLAREIQAGLLPRRRPHWPELDLVCYTKSARAIGGDFYSYHAFAHEGEATRRFAVAVGDVSGKGASAALLMAASLSLFDASLDRFFTPAERLAYLDQALSLYTKSRRQNCAMCYLELELESRAKASDLLPPYAILHVVNAGCIPPYLKHTDGSTEFPELGGFALGQGLGMYAGYQQLTFNLTKGDVIVLVTDGVIEANNHGGEMVGFNRFQDMVHRGPISSATDMLIHLQQALDAFTGLAEPRDDMTIVVIQV